MPLYPETLALAQQAVQYLLTEQSKLLKRKDAARLTKIHRSLNDLASNTFFLVNSGIKDKTVIGQLKKQALKIEKETDELSVKLWTPIELSVSSIYQRMEESITRASNPSVPRNLRDQFNNFRIRLLEQCLGARMLIQNSDLGEEHERIWQQFLQKQLGANFQVLRGGHILSQNGAPTGPQMDLIIVLAGSPVMVPGDSEGGKVNVFIDDVIAAILLTSNLTEKKLRDDWKKLQSLPDYKSKEEEYPHLKDHAWPLCYVFSAQAAPVEVLKQTWENATKAGLTKVVPQVLISLDSCSMYSGVMAWPSPRYSNSRQADVVKVWTGLEAGIGIAWTLLQIRGRSKAIRRQPLGSIVRYANILNTLDIVPATPPTWSKRFDTMFQMRDIAGIFAWGSTACFAHNRLQLRSLRRKLPGKDKIIDIELFQSGHDLEKISWHQKSNYLRWFHYGQFDVAGELLALEEWIDVRSKSNCRRRIAVFNVKSGAEIVGSRVDALQSVGDVSRLVE